MPWSAPFTLWPDATTGNNAGRLGQTVGATIYSVGLGPSGMSWKKSGDEGANWDAAAVPGGTNPPFSHVLYRIFRGVGSKLYWIYLRSGTADIWFKRSDDGGATWTDGLIISTETNVSRIAVWIVGTTIHLVGVDQGTTPRILIYFRSTDDGATWPTRTVLDDGTAGDANVPVVTAEGSFVHVAYQRASTPLSVRYRRSTDGGDTFAAAIQLDTGGVTAIRPQIVGRDGRVVAMWMSGDGPGIKLAVRRSLDNGATWQAEQIVLSDPAKDFNHQQMELGPTGGQIFAAAGTETVGSGPSEALWSTDYGATWENEVGPTIGETLANVACSDGFVHMMFDPAAEAGVHKLYSRRETPFVTVEAPTLRTVRGNLAWS